MIEVVQAKDGSPILKKEGRHFSSTYNPKQEASVWAQVQRSEVESYDRVIIFGSGSVYHIQSFLEMYVDKSILVIECSPDIFKVTQKWLGSHERMNIVCASNFEDLMVHDFVLKFLDRPYRVLRLASSFQSDAEIYQQLEQDLLAQNFHSLKKLISLRPRLKDCIELSSLQDETEFNFLSLRKLLDDDNQTMNQFSRITKVLDELIK